VVSQLRSRFVIATPMYLSTLMARNADFEMREG
jgi:hypothetical protein